MESESTIPRVCFITLQTDDDAPNEPTKAMSRATDVLLFAREEDGCIVGFIMLHNDSKKQIAIKVQATIPEVCTVTPNAQLLMPGEYCYVTIHLLLEEYYAKVTAKKKLRFLVQAKPVPFEASDRHAVWNDTSRLQNKHLQQIKIKVKLEPGLEVGNDPEKAKEKKKVRFAEVNEESKAAEPPTAEKESTTAWQANIDGTALLSQFDAVAYERQLYSDLDQFLGEIIGPQAFLDAIINPQLNHIEKTAATRMKSWQPAEPQRNKWWSRLWQKKRPLFVLLATGALMLVAGLFVGNWNSMRQIEEK